MNQSNPVIFGSVTKLTARRMNAIVHPMTTMSAAVNDLVVTHHGSFSCGFSMMVCISGMLVP